MRKRNIFLLIIIMLFSIGFGMNSVNAARNGDDDKTLAMRYNVKTAWHGPNKVSIRASVKGIFGGVPYKGTGFANNLNVYCVAAGYNNAFDGAPVCLTRKNNKYKDSHKCQSKADIKQYLTVDGDWDFRQLDGNTDADKKKRETFKSKLMCAKQYLNIYNNNKRSIVAGYIVKLVNEDNENYDGDKLQFYKAKSDKNGTVIKSTVDDISKSKAKEIGPYDPSIKNIDERIVKYVYKFYALNKYFASFKNAGATDITEKAFSVAHLENKGNSGNGKKAKDLINKIVTDAESKYLRDYFEKRKVWKDRKFSLSVNGKTKDLKMKRKDSYFVTSKTFKVEGVVGTRDSLTATVDGGTVSFCTDDALKNCVTPANVKNNTAYIVKVTPTNGNPASLANKKVSIKSSITYTFTYPRLHVYCEDRSTAHQIMGIYGQYKYKESASKSITLNIPSNPGPDKMEINISKIDDKGEPVSGAELELYYGNTKLSLSKQDEGTSFQYIGPKINESPFELVAKEVTTPEGYVDQKEMRYRDLVVGANSISYYFNDDNNTEIVASGGHSAEDLFNSHKFCKTTENGSDSYDGSDDAVANCRVESNPDTPADSGDNTGTDSGNTDGGSGTNPADSDSGSDTNPADSGSGSDSGTDNITKEVVCGYDKSGTFHSVDSRYCDYTKSSVEVNGNTIYLSFQNVLNTVKISKLDMTGEEEIPGAQLKICKTDKRDCTPEKTVKDVELSWVSGSTPVEFNGLKPGTYYLLETIPPLGYKLVTTSTKFSIDKDNKVTVGDTKVVNDNTVVINNQMNEITISKTDIVTTKEIPGATLSICYAYDKNQANDEVVLEEDPSGGGEEGNDSGETTTTDDEDTTDELSTNPADYKMAVDDAGNCVPVTLQDGSGEAKWISTDKPHPVKGLPAGTYYLVEVTAPYGYAMAESILFRMNFDGTLTDIKGNSLADNKIVMKDAPLKQVKTGNKALIVFIICTVASAAAALYFFGFHKHAFAGASNIKSRIKSRKIRK